MEEALQARVAADQLEQAVRLLFTMGAAVVTVAAARSAVRYLIKEGGLVLAAPPEQAERSQARDPFETAWERFASVLKETIRVLALRILLPSSVVWAVLDTDTDSRYYAALFGVGLAATVLLFAFFSVAYRLFQAETLVWRAGAAATMGGGNRGLAALMLIGGLHYANEPEALGRAQAAFLTLDAGNYVALLAVLPVLMRLFAGNRKHRSLRDAEEGTFKEIVGHSVWSARWDLAPMGLALGAAVLLKTLGPDSLPNEVSRVVGESTQLARSQLLLFLAWIYVMLSWPRRQEFQSAFFELFLLLVARGGLAAGVVWLVSVAMGTTMAATFWHPAVLAGVVLLTAPISSFAKMICEQAGAPPEISRPIGDLVLASTVLFVGLTLVATVMAALGSS